MSLQTDFEAKFPNFDEDYIDTYFTLLKDTYPCLYGATYGDSDCDNQVILYLMAHLLTLQGGNKTGNFASSKSDGDVSITYALPSNLSEQYLFYSSTQYGVIFLQLTAKNMKACFV